MPVKWDGDSSVIDNNENDYHPNWEYTMKVDMWDVLSATRESILNGHKNKMEDEEIDYLEVIDKKIYLTENYEVFYYKFLNTFEGVCISYNYYLYANGERFLLSGFNFLEDKPEYDAIFKRIAESVRFQF